MSSMPTLKPRLVVLVKQPGVVSFGFNVTATRSEPFRYVGIVVDNSLAKQAGLRSGDRVHEVNGVPVDGLPLPDVQGMVAQRRDRVDLLVADPMTDQLYRDNNEVIRGGLPETICIQVPSDDVSPSQQEFTNGVEEIEAEVVDPDTFLGDDGMEDIPPPITGYQSNGVIHSESSPMKARLCTVKKWPDYQGFGFILHGDKDDPGQSIGKVESGSPAEAAGLRPGDLVVEVNGVNVEAEYQQQVVGRIANGPVPQQTTLLVVDPDTLRFFRGHSVSVHGSMVDIERIETPPRALVPAYTGNIKVRLCHVKKWADFSGYGFILHGERGVPGTFITNIDEGSPAVAAGLLDGDKIIEINGVNVEGEEQPGAIRHIQMGIDGNTNETRLLVVDPESERYYKRQQVQVSGSMADVVYLTNPERELLPPPPVIEPQSRNSNSQYRARLCHLKKWSTFDGYGFYLQSEEGVRGICVGKVDPDSPAEAAGLRKNDRIVEVNGVNVEDDSQNDLVEKVVAIPEETRLLVADSATFQYFLDAGIMVNGNMTDVDVIEAPDR
ncbi:Na(+)/H(+) exchange regulatory cofactor NHE-RF3-like [Haliotis rubra]|uniref:Na(+)/H(+) exchange regulatory cofactor NHE-RF3-like n=1 Tax=Haliotis rubra TaxID=36100 RepID=UPI001EE62D25|nr:Na(+)/H(+) exchange regulatory cofactor NHE-RF3-like [Haliotis rubra]